MKQTNKLMTKTDESACHTRSRDKKKKKTTTKKKGKIADRRRREEHTGMTSTTRLSEVTRAPVERNRQTTELGKGRERGMTNK
jgi:hypothetical protein